MNSASPTADVGRKCSSDTGCCADPQPFDLSLETVRFDVPDGTGVRTIFSCFDFKLPQGAMLGIRGPSGAGKTSFLKCLSGIITPTEGVVRWGTLALSQCTESVRDRWRGQHCGFLFQDFRLFEDLTALDNVLLPLTFRGTIAAHDRETAREMLAARGIRTNTRAGDLSRGEMQRTALVRVLMGRPAVILADEPTANLDEARGDIVVDDLMSAAQSLSASLILVSHSDRVLKRLPLTAEIRADALSRRTNSPLHDPSLDWSCAMNIALLLKSELRRSAGILAGMALIIALALSIAVAAGICERMVKASAAQSADDFDLLIGARGSSSALLLGTVFLRDEMLPIVPASAWANIREAQTAKSSIRWAAPVAFGDRTPSGRTIVGTTRSF